MKLKTKKPTTSSQRHLIQLNTKHLNSKFLIKKKIKKLHNSSGRNNSGQITIRHKGGGHKKRYRKINFFRTETSTGVTVRIEYDPNRNSHIAAIYDISKKNFFYILAPKGLKIGDILETGPKADSKIGHSLPVSDIPVGTYIHSISPKENTPAQISRAAGAFSQIKEKNLKYVKIELNSGEQRLLSPKCYATIGVVSNDLVFLTQLGKAGRARWLNKRPTVRGVAMNPIDHPHGGGEGKKSGKGKTPWGKNTKNGRTSKSKNKLIIKPKFINE